ncbi:hypothetical protein ENBRE01_1509 [Enteropsectra breve]|nr:hypothetical protein ENBRE01_1509 [Enteropsectra breve]
MEEELAKRNSLLKENLPLLFEHGVMPEEKLIKNILIHQSLGSNPTNINKIKSIKVNTEAVCDMYGPKLEIIRGESEGPKICPLSQSVIKEPWTGACGHVFEKNAIMEYRKRGVNKCPVKGCNKNTIL